MKRRKEVDSELQDIKHDIQYLKTRMEALCHWITNKFHVDFGEPSLHQHQQPLSATTPTSIPIPQHHQYQYVSGIHAQDKLKTNGEKVQEHSYCISNTSATSSATPQPNPNLYDMVEEDDLIETHPRDKESISPTGDSSILNTPKKSKRLLSKSPSKNNPISRGEIATLVSLEPFPAHNLFPTSPQPSSSHHVDVHAVGKNPHQHQLPSANANDNAKPNVQTIQDASNKEPKKKRNRGKRNRTTKSQAASSTNTGNKTSSSPKSPQIIQCEICGKLINGHVAMKRHAQTHNSVRPHNCEICAKSFQRKFHLKTHMLIHNGEKKHQCRFCGKLFLLPKDIVAHERVHTGEKPYSCAHCPRHFTLKSHLVMHTRIHTGEKPYKCDSCDKCFTQANSLRVHKKTHLASSSSIVREEKVVEVEVEAQQEISGTDSAAVSSVLIPMASVQNGTGEYSIRSSNNFNVIGQLTPISLSNQFVTQMPSSSTTLRIPLQVQVPMLLRGSAKDGMKIMEPISSNSVQQMSHSLTGDICYYDLETL